MDGCAKEMKCQICGKNATTIYFRVLTCGGCQAFYKRAVKRKNSYVCYKGGTCPTEADSSVHTRCKACRFYKYASLAKRTRGVGPQTPKNAPNPREKENSVVPPAVSICNSDRSRTASPEDDFDSMADDYWRPIDAISPDTCQDVQIQYSQDYVPLTAGTSLYSPNSSSDIECYDDESGSFYDMHSPPDQTFYMSDGSRDLKNDMRLSLRKSDGNFVPFLVLGMGGLEDNHQQMISTVATVSKAAQAVFGDQMASWTLCRDRALLYGSAVAQPETCLASMIAALNYHNSDNIERTQRFVAFLPGMTELDISARKCTTEGWKHMIYWMIHHAEFMTGSESYITVGPQQYHYCRYWQARISDWPLVVFFYKFCTEFREVGLNQTERYLLMAVVMFEPAGDQNKPLHIVHRHYTSTLLDVIKARCSADEFVAVCRKLERLFGIFKMVHRLHGHYFGHRPEEIQCPPDTVGAKAKVIEINQQSAC